MKSNKKTSGKVQIILQDREMANNEDRIITIIGIIIPVTISVLIMWWKGVFDKIKETGKKELAQVKKESALEQTDAVYDYLLKNITDRVKSIENNHTNMMEKVTDLKEDVAVMKRDIDHLVDSVDRLSRNINDGNVRRR